MVELYNIGINDEIIKSMLEINPEICDLEDQDIIDKKKLLKIINCSNKEIKNIICSNPNYLNRTNEEITKLFGYLLKTGFKYLNILIDSNPFILNLEPFEIKNYINNRINNGENINDIVDDLDSNPYLFQEI